MKKLLIILFGIPLILSLLEGCNLCPNNPDDSSFQDELLISYNSQSGKKILVLSDINNLSFREILSDVSANSAVAENGDFCFIQKNYKDMYSALFMGNVFSKNTKILEIENPIFSIFNPVISPKSNAIAFSGGKNQLYIWINNPQTKTTYIDKVTNNFFERSLPIFTNDGKYLCFLTQTPNELTLSVIDIQKPDEIVQEHKFYRQTGIFGHDTRLSITNDNKVFFVANDENAFYLNLIDLKTSIISTYTINKSVIQLQTGEISKDGKTALLVSSDGVIWATKFESEKLKTYQLTHYDECSNYVDVRWKKDNSMFLAFKVNCNNELTNSKKLYLFKVDNKNDETKIISSIYFSSNVVDAHWR